VPFPGPSRWFLCGALAHLSAAGVLLLFGTDWDVLTTHWDVLLWLLLIGFVGCTTLGFSLHLFPAVARRLMPKGVLEGVAFASAETSVVVGAFALFESASLANPGWLFSFAAFLFLVSVGLVVGLFATALAQPRLTTAGPEKRPGDIVTVPLFLASWSAAFGAGGLFVLSGFSGGPGFGWWLAAVHLYVLGHATLLIAAVSLRLVPRSLDADPPRAAAVALASLGGSGAALVPAGMLVVSPSGPSLLALFAAPEAAFAALFFGLLVYLGMRARTPRPQLGLHLSGVALLLSGGGIGLWMVSQPNYVPVVSHALVNVLGFVGLTILIMWFGMIAPFQRISHAWTRRMLWGLSAGWLGAVLALAWVGETPETAPESLTALGGGLLLGVAITWGAGTFPVLFPRVNPLPGLTTDQIRALRNRWKGR
jgi:hypothetical protein